MSIIARGASPVNPDADRPPFDPDADDRAYWTAGGVDYYTAPVEDWDAYLDMLAAESEALDRLERALGPDDLARAGPGGDDRGDDVCRGEWGGHGLD